MDIYNFVIQNQEINTSTSIEDLKKNQYFIYDKLIELENNLFVDYCSFCDEKESQIYRNQTNLDKQLIFLDKIYLQYQYKEEKYKYPTMLTSIQNQINSYNNKIKTNLQNINEEKLRKITIFTNLVSFENQKIYLEKKICSQKTDIEWPIVDWEQDLLKIQNRYKIAQLKIKSHFELYNFFFKKEQKKYFSILHSILYEEITLVFKFKKLQKKSQQKIKIMNKYNQVEIENLNIMIDIEKDISQNSINKLNIKLETEVKKFNDIKINIRKQKKNLDLKIKESLNLKNLSISDKYNQFESKIKILQKLDNKLEQNLQIINKLKTASSIVEEDIQRWLEKNIRLEKKILKLEYKKKKIIPGIIKKYHFYMNFFHQDIKDTKIKINVLQNRLLKIKDKNFNMLDKTKLTRQKINILKKLQININQKINEYQERT